MNIRTRETMVSFDHPFRLSNVDGILPAGTYRVVTDEEQILGLSFIAYRRVATVLHIPAISAPQGRYASLDIDPVELEAAMLKDHQPSAGNGDLTSSVAANQVDAAITGKTNVTPVSQCQPHL
ncbi:MULTISPECIES: hypothetical protein [Xanthobacter]|uniref:hypothetical protein n=1 Tax=Xanthobacter TaxID=279 RepID=UPI0032BF6645